MGIIKGNRKLNSPPMDDMDKLWSPMEREHVQSMLGMLVTGSVMTVREKLNKFIEATQADELIITSDTYEPSDRMRSYELIAEAKQI